MLNDAVFAEEQIVIPFSGGDHEPDDARRLQLRHKLGVREHALDSLFLDHLHRRGRTIGCDDAPALLVQLPCDVRAHLAETEDADLAANRAVLPTTGHAAAPASSVLSGGSSDVVASATTASESGT